KYGEIALRESVESMGGSVSWNNRNNSSIVHIGGALEKFYVGDAHGTRIINGKMYTSSLAIENVKNVPKGYAMNVYASITDDVGKLILRTWLNGDGSDQIYENDIVSDYIYNNEYIQNQIEFLTKTAIDN